MHGLGPHDLKNAGTGEMAQKTQKAPQEKIYGARKRLQKIVAALGEHDLFSHSDEIRHLEESQNSIPLSNEADVEEGNQLLMVLYEKTEADLKSYFQQQSTIVKTVALSWLSSICDAEPPAEAYDWAFVMRDKESKLKLVDGGYSNVYELSDRLYAAFLSYPKEALEIVRFAAYLNSTLLESSSTFMRIARVKRYTESSANFSFPKANNIAPIPTIFTDFLTLYLKKRRPSGSADLIITQVELCNKYMQLTEEHKKNFTANVSKLTDLKNTDQKILGKYINDQAFLDAAEHCLPCRVPLRKISDIPERIDRRLNYRLDSPKDREKIYREIIKKYRSSIAPSPTSTAHSFSLSDTERKLLNDICYSTRHSPAYVLRKAIEYAQSECKNHKVDPAVKACITATRAKMKSKTFKLTPGDLKAIQRLIKSISSTKLPLPRKINQSLAVGIAIRLYENEKSRCFRASGYTGEKISPNSLNFLRRFNSQE